MNDELTREERAAEVRKRFERAVDQLLDAAELEQLKHAQELPALEALVYLLRETDVLTSGVDAENGT